jgi:hypothetical protein
MHIITTGLRKLSCFPERRLGRLPAMDQLSMLAVGFDGEAHFFFLRFFFITAACARKASARERICVDTKASADRCAIRSEISACFRKAFEALLISLKR